MSRIIQISTCVIGDNINSEQQMITTALYDDGSIYEGSMQNVSGDYFNGFKREMIWTMVALPIHGNDRASEFDNDESINSLILSTGGEI